jgi:phosphoribosyl-ATP pyrophosphohydrolase/phosphoribosyl-AMP cyclohydrolase
VVDLSAVKFDERGLVPAIVQDITSGQVLMLAYMNRESLEKTIASGTSWFWSRSRQELWNKGASSGNIQKVKEIRYDCDGDALLLKVEQTGPACHTGEKSCFYRSLISEPANPGAEIISELYALLRSRIENQPEGSYVAKITAGNGDRALQKVVEEAGEMIIAGKNGDREEIIYESADLLFHLLVCLAKMEIPPEEVYQELARRRK